MINEQVSLLLCRLKHTLYPKIASFGRMQNSLGHHCIIGMAGCLSYVSLVLAITILLVFQPFFISCNCLLIPNSRLYSDLYVLLSPSLEVKPIDVLYSFRVCLNDLLFFPLYIRILFYLVQEWHLLAFVGQFLAVSGSLLGRFEWLPFPGT